MAPRPLTQFATGAAVTLGSTVLSCALAMEIEKRTHQLFFWYAPHWYARVEHANGLTAEQLDSVRTQGYRPCLQMHRTTTDHLSLEEIRSRLKNNGLLDTSIDSVLTAKIPRHYTSAVEEDAKRLPSTTVGLNSDRTENRRVMVAPTAPQEPVWRQEMIACSMTG